MAPFIATYLYQMYNAHKITKQKRSQAGLIRDRGSIVTSIL